MKEIPMWQKITGIGLFLALLTLLVIWFRNQKTAAEAAAAKNIQKQIVSNGGTLLYTPPSNGTTGNAYSYSGASISNPVGVYSIDGKFTTVKKVTSPNILLGAIIQDSTDLGNDFFFKIVDPINNAYYVAKSQVKEI